MLTMARCKHKLILETGRWNISQTVKSGKYTNDLITAHQTQHANNLFLSTSVQRHDVILTSVRSHDVASTCVSTGTVIKTDFDDNSAKVSVWSQKID